MAKQETKKPAKVLVEVLRAFYYGGQRRAVGEVVEMTETDYLQWRLGQKVKLSIPPSVQASPESPSRKSQKKEDKETK